MKIPPMSDRALPPVLVMVSDGQPTDNFERGLDQLMSEPWGKKAVRIAISIGADADDDVLQRFIGHPEIKPLQANNPESLVKYIKWVSTAVLKSASSPASQVKMAAPAADTAADPAADPSDDELAALIDNLHVPIPQVPQDDDIDAQDVW